MDVIARIATGGDAVSEITLEEIKKAVRMLKKNKASYPEGIYGYYDGYRFFARNLTEFKKMVEDYVYHGTISEGMTPLEKLKLFSE